MDCLTNLPSESGPGESRIRGDREDWASVRIGAPMRASELSLTVPGPARADALRQSYRPKANTPLFVVIATYCCPPAA